MTEKELPNTLPHCFNDYWRNKGRAKLQLAMTDKKYGKTQPTKLSYKRNKAGNKKFALGDKVKVGDGRNGHILSSYKYDGVTFYQIVFFDTKSSWYDFHCGEVSKVSPYGNIGWYSSRLIKGVDNE